MRASIAHCLLILFTFNIFSKNLYSTVLESLISNQDFSATSAGMGQTGVAKANNISYLSVNPASVNHNVFLDFYVDQNLSFAGNYITYFAAGMNLFNQNFAVSGAVWLPQDIEEINDFGASVGSGTVFDTFWGLTWGNSFEKNFNWKTNNWVNLLGRSLSGTYEFGTTAKIVHSRLFEYTVTVPAIDFGGVFRRRIDALAFLPSRSPYNLSVGASIMNIGPDATYNQISESQPFRWSTGVDYIFLAMKDHEISSLLTIEKRLERNLTYHLGIEYTSFSFIKTRLGYILGDITRGFTGGMSVFYDYYSIYDAEFNYGLGLVRDLGMEHQFSFRMNYNKDILSKKAERVEKESNKIYDDIDHEVQDIVQACVNDYHKLKESYPKNLVETNLVQCYKEYGFSGVPNLVKGRLAYDSQTGIVSIDATEKIVKNIEQFDEIYLIDGSIIKGEILEISSRQFLVKNDLGKVQIERELVSYTKFAQISDEDLLLLNQINDFIKQFHEKNGIYPENLGEISKKFFADTGKNLPAPSTGRYLYSSSQGVVSLIDNIPASTARSKSLPSDRPSSLPDNSDNNRKKLESVVTPENNSDEELLLN